MNNKNASVVDADGLILGRMASVVAKRLLNGEKITIVNSEKSIISGKRKSILLEAKRFLEVGHPRKGPFHPRLPDRIVRRTVRGMLPWRHPKGKQAYRRLQVFIGIPEKLGVTETETIKGAKVTKLTCAYTTVGKIAKEIGWNPDG